MALCLIPQRALEAAGPAAIRPLTSDVSRASTSPYPCAPCRNQVRAIDLRFVGMAHRCILPGELGRGVHRLRRARGA
jgi:hypothetical protein